GNPHVQAGLTLDGVGWAFRSVEAANWHPLTWLSHMLDYQLYGANPTGHHLTSLLLHLANVLLLFWVLQLMTGAVWRSAIVAAIFAAHPLNVESVAWIAERKNVLSTFFWLLTILAYWRYVGHPNWNRYLLIACLFACGLMSKPMLVTLPFTLLLLDYWPLRRLENSQDKRPDSRSGTRETARPQKQKRDKTFSTKKEKSAATITSLVLEKLPLFALAAASSAITIVVQKKGGAVSSTLTLSMWERIGNALISYVIYLKEMVWPNALAVLYPYHRGSYATWLVALAALFLIAATGFAFWAGKRFRFVPWGWLWYVGTLVPVIGIVQVGLQAHADRYCYVPMIGVLVALVWGFSEAAKPLRVDATRVGGAIAAALVLCFVVITGRQVAHWRDSEALFQEAAAVTQDNYIAYTNLGESLASAGKMDAAAKAFETSIQINPDFDEAQHDYGMALVQQGKLDDAVAHFKRAIEINPKFTDAYNKLGATLARQERYDEAAPYFYKVIELDPDYPSAYANLGFVFEKQGKPDQALEADYKALRLIESRPTILHTAEGSMMAVQTDYRVGLLLSKKGNLTDAIRYFKDALRLKPDYAPAQQGLNAVMDVSEQYSNSASQQP
ncbi:MAG TPA: tetratricopeptide repeat protein, partial [Blastocatellia bacterium]|nr:tetratricopeptide repeat protein [Blastocatellia bacterium]